MVDPVKALQRSKNPPMCPSAKEENTVQLHVGYEPGQGSQVANEIYLSVSQPPDVDASQAEKESDYVLDNCKCI